MLALSQPLLLQGGPLLLHNVLQSAGTIEASEKGGGWIVDCGLDWVSILRVCGAGRMRVVLLGCTYTLTSFGSSVRPPPCLDDDDADDAAPKPLAVWSPSLALLLLLLLLTLLLLLL